MRALIKGSAHSVLALLLFLSGVPLGEHHHSADVGFSICNPGCDINDHHFIAYDCDDCLNKNNHKSFLKGTLLFVFYQKNKSLNINNDFFRNHFDFSHFLSRAPPILL